jgi:hypothetical protein
MRPNTAERDFAALAKAAREAVERNELASGLDRLHTFLTLIDTSPSGRLSAISYLQAALIVSMVVCAAGIGCRRHRHRSRRDAAM